jgi:predicted porin
MFSRQRLAFRSGRTSIFLLLILLPTILTAQPTDQQESSTEVSQKVEDPSPESATKEEKQQEAREREITEEEDPLSRRESDRVNRPEQWAKEPDEFRLYGSIRVRHRWTGDESFWGDGSSRIGINGRWQYQPYQFLFGRLEAGVNLLDELDYLINEGANSPQTEAGQSLFARLMYVGIETPNFIMTGGKNWSSYYRVSGFTDRFQGTGASASGTFNANTDGGPTGTGRADRILQTRVMIDELEMVGLKPFRLNIQVQHGEPIPKVPDANYATTIGLSALLVTRKDLSFGLAYNHANIADAEIQTLKSYGIDGDAQAAIAGLRWFSDKWYMATTIARLTNHETTDEDIYFDGWGWEVYGHYNLHKRWWAVTGWNILEPDSDQTQAGDYNIKYGVIELRYSFKKFEKMLYANTQLESSDKADGTRRGNIYTIGVRWDLP